MQLFLDALRISITRWIWSCVRSGSHSIPSKPVAITCKRTKTHVFRWTGVPCLVYTRVWMNFHTCPNEADYPRKQTLLRFKQTNQLWCESDLTPTTFIPVCVYKQFSHLLPESICCGPSPDLHGAVCENERNAQLSVIVLWPLLPSNQL